MEKITRNIVREKEGRALIYPFTTFDVIFQDDYDHKFYGVFEWLKYVFEHGMQDKPDSPSQAKKLILKTEQLPNHEFCKYALDACYHGAGNKQHALVEAQFLDNHPDCIAVEVPLFDDIMSGCLDILLMTSDKIYLLDFKPDAHKETHAATQLYHYKKLFVYNTGVSPNLIECGYFDDQNYFKVSI